MTKRDVLHDIGIILSVWLISVTAIFSAPGLSDAVKYALFVFDLILVTLTSIVYFRWERLSKVPKTTWLGNSAFAVGGVFYFFTTYLMWSLVRALWVVPPEVGGYYVVTWFHLFLVAVLIVGGVGFYMGVDNIVRFYRWRRNRKKGP